MKAFAFLAVLLATVPAAAQTNCGQLPKSWEGTAYAVSGDTLAGRSRPWREDGLPFNRTKPPQYSSGGLKTRKVV